MDKAKAAVSNFMSKSGHHDTTVHESVAPHVQKETVNEQRREEKQIARDHEVHQDHYHTSVQPVKHSEVLPEQHHHNAVGVEHQTHDHRNHGETKERLHNEAAQFQHESKRAPVTSTTTSALPEIHGERVHHHVHETIQPVVHKETIEPHVVHTTVPVHHTHHNKAEHHTTSALPAMSMGEFQKQGGTLTGREAQHDHFDGEPNNFGNVGHHHGHGGISGQGQHSGLTSGTTGTAGTTGTTGTTGHHHTGTGVGSGVNSTGTGSGVGTGTGTGLNNTVGGTPRLNDPSNDSARHAAQHATGTHNDSTSTTGKPSLLDKLNPMKDSDGDGKKGFMK